jgi:hypothetical protein
MRDKLNNDPKYQVGAIAILLLIGVFFFISKSGGGEEAESEETVATVSVAGTGATATATGATAGEAVEGAVEGAVEAGAGASSSAALPSPAEAPPLPRPVTAAYKGGATVVLLVVHDGSIDDDLVRRSLPRLSAMGGVQTFIVPASQVARYGAITLGVDVSRVPALIVLTPKDLAHGTAEASVSYGYLIPAAMEQAVLDARYDGPSSNYHPN